MSFLHSKNCLFVNFLQVSRQIKTLQYALSSAKCMEDGWTIRPPTPPVVEPAANNDDFAIEVNTTLLQVCLDLDFIT